jgi:hypothetical protein
MTDPKLAPSSDWRPHRHLAGTHEIAVGVIHRDSHESTGLSVHLLVKVRQKPVHTHYKFSLFQTDVFGQKRVYQLDSAHPALGRPVDHSWPHEHIGDERKPFYDRDHPKNFEDAIQHFMRATNLAFEDPIESPEIFRLKMS